VGSGKGWGAPFLICAQASHFNGLFKILSVVFLITNYFVILGIYSGEIDPVGQQI
jgi:hypothetical protein